MLRAESTVASASHRRAAPARVHGWGGGHGVAVSMLSPDGEESLRQAVLALRSRPGRGAIARGLGRSYGDAAQLSHGLVIDTAALGAFEFDADQCTVTAQAGVPLSALLDALAPAGFLVPVVPGTQHVTVAGAIASDIHGKNHGVAGTFGSHVGALGLLSADGELRELEPGEPAFEATLGGMGLTGVIVWARIRLRPVASALLSVDTDRVSTLDEALGALSAPGGPHRVAWLDLLGSRAGRGVVTRAEHLDSASDAQAEGRATVKPRATVPASWPAGLLRPETVAAFNALRFGMSPRRARGKIESFAGHMFPLDALRSWPRLYGRHGLIQYQLVVPPGRESTLERVIETLRAAGAPVYLAVLKDFGPANDAPLSFPIAGWTLALDLPRAAPGLGAALRRCDELVVEAGGRVYLSKDARLEPDAVEAMYPRLQEWRSTRDELDPDGLWRSDLGLRTGLVSR